MRVAVVGGGVVGLACAWCLLREGGEVVVLERNRCGEAASLGNAGWITPALSNPLPGPETTLQALRWACRGDSPFRLRPRLDADFARWCWSFWRSCSRERNLAGMRALLGLNARTLELVGLDLTLDRRRLQAVARAAGDYLADWQPTGPQVEWAGLRRGPPGVQDRLRTVPDNAPTPQEVCRL